MSEKSLLLIVDDEPIAQMTMKALLNTGEYRLEFADNGYQALEKAAVLMPDLIILDIMLPGMDGIEVCKNVRREMSVPILMLTARDDEIDRVVGLEVGADDYLTKPFSMRELMARVKAQLRRTQFIRTELEKLQPVESGDPHKVLTFGNLVINQTRREVTLDSQVLSIKPQEYDLLVFFTEHKGQMLSREFILERVWGWDFIGDSRTVDVHVRWLRQRIEKDPASPERIVTVRGGGYRFEG